MEFRADLHCHTNCSDGALSPDALIAHAKELGLSAISITDHDTLNAYSQISAKGFLIGVGVEFSSSYRKEPVHILGYDVDLDNTDLLELCQRHTLRRKKRNREILQNLTVMGMPISEEELYEEASEAVIGRPHIAKLLVKKGYLPTVQEAFHRFLGSGKSAYAAGEVIGIEETLAIIKAANGKAFLAHPHLLSGKRRVIEVLGMGFDGIEAYYAKFHRDQNLLFLKLAQEKGLLISGGSDFHGEIKPHNPLGCSWVDEEHFHRIFQRPRRL